MSVSCTKNFFRRFCIDEYQIDSIAQSSFFSNDLLPSLGARINQSTKLRKYIISPYNSRYRWSSLPQHAVTTSTQCYLSIYSVVDHCHNFPSFSGLGRCYSLFSSFTLPGFAHSSLLSWLTSRMLFSLSTTLSMVSLPLTSSSLSSWHISITSLIFLLTIPSK